MRQAGGKALSLIFINPEIVHAIAKAKRQKTAK
jgi:hypothetical protein